MKNPIAISALLALAIPALPAGAQNTKAPAPPAPQSAAPQDTDRFSLDRAIQTAVESSSAIGIARRNVSIAEKRAGETAAEGRVHVTGNATATRFDAPTNVAFDPSQPSITVLPDHTEAFTISATQPIDLSGQIRAATNQARLQTLSDRLELERLTRDRRLQARTLYYDLLRAEHQVAVAEANLRAARTQQETAKKLFDSEVGQKIDLLRANTNVALAEQEVQRAVNSRDVARSAFNDLVGRPLTAPVTLDDVPGVTVGTDVTDASGAVGTAKPTQTPFAPPVAEVDAIKLEDSITTATRQRAEVQQAETTIRAADLGVTLARAGNQPSLSISASGNYYPTFSLQTPRDKTAALTASLTVPFYDGGATRNRVAAARLQKENATQARDAAKSSVTLEVRQAYLNLRTAARQIEAANAALEQAVAARQLAQIRYAGQVGLFLEVTDAQAALVRAENAQVDAVYDYLIARATFERAMGQ
jgi:outer membrane protein TolC